MERVLTELSKECEYTAQMYIAGLEKKEIADLKCKAVSTINNQLQKAFEILHVKNGRELCRKFYERVSGMEFTFDFSPATISLVTLCLLFVLIIDSHFESVRMRRSKTIAKVEMICRTRAKKTECLIV